ncbi:MAG: hypothetical protein K6T59_16150, partial [Bryobacteraceae bacterium]|nr:hypothetical protein [Bryobacteraceae bacterium]
MQYLAIVRPIELKNVLTIFTKHPMGKLVFFVAASQSFGTELFHSSAVSPKGKGYGGCLRGDFVSIPRSTDHPDGSG